MATYVVLMKLTPEGAKNLKEGPQRLAKANEIAAREGAKITAGYATLGRYDMVFLIEGPEDISKTLKSCAAVAMMGAHSIETMPALPIQDFYKLVAEM